MKKVVALVLSLVLLLGLCSLAQAAVQIPVTADQTAISQLDHGVTAADMPVIKDIEWADGQITITVDPSSMPDLSENDFNIRIYTMDDNGNWGDDHYFEPIGTNGIATFAVPEGTSYTRIAEIECSTDFDLAGKYTDAYGYYNGDGELERYTLSVRTYNGVTENIYADYTADNQLTYEHYNVYTDGVNENYTVYYYSTSGALREYAINTTPAEGTNLRVSFDQYGRVIWANWYNDQNDYYWQNGQWYDFADGEVVATAPIDVTTIEAPYAETYAPAAPATKLENLDLTKGELTTGEDGYSYYYDGAVNARYDENGNLVRYSYFNFEGTQQEIFRVAENGNVISVQTMAETDEGHFQTVSGIEYYANSGEPKGSFTVGENGEYVYYAVDGTVESINIYDEETGCNYFWNPWWGWEAYDDQGNPVEVDPATLPDPASYKGPVLTAITAPTKDDLTVPTTSAMASPQLPIELSALPSITGTKLEDGKLSVSVSDDLSAMSFEKTDDYLYTGLSVDYMLDGEHGWLSEDDAVYNADTKTYELNIPEGAEITDVQIYITRAIDYMSYNYSISEDGVYVYTSDDRLGNVYQNYQYKDGKLIYASTSLEDYYLSANFDEEGKLESYDYSIAENASASFLPDGTLAYIWQYDEEAGKTFFWDAETGWHTRKYDAETGTYAKTPSEAPANAVDPEEVKPLIIVSKKPQHVWFPKNTLGLAAVSLKDLGISSDWHNVAPVDLTKDGTTVFTLVGADAWILGQAYVTVAEGNVTVDYAILDGHGYMKSEKMNWFLSKADLTEENLKADSNYAFGEPVSIADQLGGAEMAILFIDSKITFRQPYFDAYNYSTRYYRNRENWKEYREGLIEMIGE